MQYTQQQRLAPEVPDVGTLQPYNYHSEFSVKTLSF